METIDTCTPDVEVAFRFNGMRRTSVRDGYRPAHRVLEDYLTTGLHRYFDVDEVAPDGEACGTITFITPECYPNSMWEGRVIDIQEGERVVGTATVKRILNPILKRE